MRLSLSYKAQALCCWCLLLRVFLSILLKQHDPYGNGIIYRELVETFSYSVYFQRVNVIIQQGIIRFGMSVLEFSLYYLIVMQLEQVNANQKQIAINIIDGLGLVLKS